MPSRWMNALVLLGLTSACATTQLASGRLERTEASIRAAEEVGALAVPDARLHLQLAKDQTAQARKLADDGDKRAGVMLTRAQADADLAVALAREATAHNEAARATEDLKAVKARGTP